MRQLLYIGMGCLMLCLSCAVKAAEGSLVIIGGALRPDNAAVWEHVVKLAGGKGASIAVFPTASASPAQSADNIVRQLRHYGGAPFVVPVAPKLAGNDYRKAADDGRIAARVLAAGGAYFSGGDQGRITQALRRADGSNSKVLDALWSMYQRGGVIAGSSAGAAIMSSTMFYQPGSVIDTLMGPMRDGVELADGLGFVGKDVFVDQHLLARGRFARMLPAMVKKGYRLGLGVEENSAVVVTKGQQLEVIGQTGALWIDLREAASDSRLAGFNVANARISYLDRGDIFYPASGTFRAGAGKVEHKVDVALPADLEREPNGSGLFTADVLANKAVLYLMENLVLSDRTQAIGITVNANSEPMRGMEFKFSKIAQTRSYSSSTDVAISIRDLRLDVRPIEMAKPLYR